MAKCKTKRHRQDCSIEFGDSLPDKVLSFRISKHDTPVGQLELQPTIELHITIT